MAFPILALCMLGAAYSSAAVATPFTYTYQGNSFDEILGMTYSDMDAVSGSFTMDARTNIGLPFDDYTPLVTSFSFTDGVQTISNTSRPPPFTSFLFETDDRGNIDLWSIQLIVRFREMTPVQGLVTANMPSRDPELSFVQDFGALDVSSGGRIVSNPGRWTQAIPEPATILLLGLGLISVVLGMRRPG